MKKKSGISGELNNVRTRLKEAEDVLHAIRRGEVDALLVNTPDGDRIFTLRGAETPYRIIVESISEGAVTLISDGIILYANAQFSTMLGITLERIIGASFHEFVSEQEREGLPELFEQGLKTDIKKEVNLVTRDGGLLPVHLSLRRLPIDEEKTGISMVITDISERKRAEETLKRAHDELNQKVIERTEALKAERDRAQRYLDIAGVMFVALSRDQRVSLINQKGCEVLGYSEDEIIGRNWFDHFIPPEDRESVKEVFDRLLKGDIEPVEYYENPVLTRYGEHRVIAWHNSVIRDEAGEILEMLSSGEDITGSKKAEEARRESEERYRVITESALDAIITIDEKSRITLVNPAVERVFGYTAAELYGKPLTMLMPEALRERHMQAVEKHIKTGRRHLPWGAVEMPGLHKDGREIPVEISYGEFKKNGRFFFIGIIRDVTERKKAEETIRYQMHHDLLTGLPNRTQLMLLCELEVTQAERNGKHLALLHLDLDRFKIINDSLGHVIGDRAILAVAERLKSLIRKSDTLARIGSDEFVIILPDINRAEDAALSARKIMEKMRKLLKVDSHELYITSSIGISMFPEDGSRADVLLRNANAAVSHAKERGRNNFQFFNPALNVRTVERLLLESSLRQSIERDELVLYYQPQTEIATGKVLGVEALVRWRHVDLGLLMPVQFIPVAEEMGFITAIDEWVIRTACAQNKAWQDAGFKPVTVSVNLSAQQFQQSTLVEMVAEFARETGMDPRYLNVEVTESTAMRDIKLALPNLNGLSDLGVGLAIDDFGTGYSSLNYLKRFPVKTLKIDQSFIRNVATDSDDREIVRAVIAMGHNLKLTVIAEGVETDEQLSFLRDNDCDQVQGFLFSKPLPPEGISGFLAAGK
jgi:diguanylate cyclase (GGDEF)-like protein/PAS domain S-box-containing protein